MTGLVKQVRQDTPRDDGNGFPLTLAQVLFFAVLSLASLVLYVVLLAGQVTVPLVLSFASFVLFAASVVQWMLCPRFRRRRGRASCELVMPVRSDMVPRKRYRVSQLLMVLGVVLFCAGNVLLCVFELQSPSVALVFVAAALVAATTYATGRSLSR